MGLHENIMIEKDHVFSNANKLFNIVFSSKKSWRGGIEWYKVRYDYTS